MTSELSAGRSAVVTTPATSANLGPGFDALGLALDWRDTAQARVIPSGLEVSISGEGADCLPKDATHLVIHTLKEALETLGARAPGLSFEAHNTIPLARGLGSSSSAIASALALAWGLARPGEPLDRSWAFALGVKLEGHPDNIGPAIYGGLTIGWNSSGIWKLTRCETSPDLRVTTLVPPSISETHHARSAMPSEVPLADAIANGARTALLVNAVRDNLALLLDATEDRLHQQYRRELYPESLALVEHLRAEGLAAIISGAGSTVAVLHDESQSALVDLTVEAAAHDSRSGASGFVSRRVALGEGVALQ